jgi:hypothetical protein
MSGGLDGAIRFWDIRRAGCFLVLDQLRSQLGKRPPFLDSSMDKVCSLFLICFCGFNYFHRIFACKAKTELLAIFWLQF